MTHTLQGKVVAITGGARGIGYATAQQLIAEGATVAIGDIDAIRLKEAGTELGVNTCPTVDVTSIDSFTDFLDEVERSLGPIDVLINNAGVMPVGLVVDEDDALTRRVLDINLLGSSPAPNWRCAGCNHAAADTSSTSPHSPAKPISRVSPPTAPPSTGCSASPTRRDWNPRALES